MRVTIVTTSISIDKSKTKRFVRKIHHIKTGSDIGVIIFDFEFPYQLKIYI